MYNDIFDNSLGRNRTANHFTRVDHRDTKCRVMYIEYIHSIFFTNQPVTFSDLHSKKSNHSETAATTAWTVMIGGRIELKLPPTFGKWLNSSTALS